MAYSILVTGGARSGKSRYAEERTCALGPTLVYIATAQAFDAEMEQRIALHQERRGPEWQTVNAPLALPDAIRQSDGKGPCLVDCLTLWLSNLMFAEEDIEAATDDLIKAIQDRQDPIVFVTNEVGAGIVPENAIARRFRDEAGRLNQIIAAHVDEVYVSISGLPLKLKPSSE
ncbi:MAG: bifunctional adenosylcobinamide kinase/adenosylcobinamide-phosphate guanylyltransferase [Candidatus Puniceispirillaceae bacterium]